jgi:hypothetical protein
VGPCRDTHQPILASARTVAISRLARQAATPRKLGANNKKAPTADGRGKLPMRGRDESYPRAQRAVTAAAQPSRPHRTQKPISAARFAKRYIIIFSAILSCRTVPLESPTDLSNVAEVVEEYSPLSIVIRRLLRQSRRIEPPPEIDTRYSLTWATHLKFARGHTPWGPPSANTLKSHCKNVTGSRHVFCCRALPDPPIPRYDWGVLFVLTAIEAMMQKHHTAPISHTA